ncbi:ATPase family AAA domain-containing protein 5 isoform X1 [Corythoichthys intestinalis]|uniref:ATPase family AAA domain-containing protein 5 isoform X1 n=1 Tax=Corythoichthys intestinalis TaxID=161448 RepID=UPI0025A569C5|nr:ATPase family AAA domain-containing protein 5 isoform X1 [Corythoichthys intestinalis]
MAGVVAMASTIEDFDTQPCKKSSKDGGSPVVKTITSYFSPIAKAVEKPFSPPRSSNIMDYFNRGPLNSKVKTSPLEHPKETGQSSAERDINPDVAVKQPTLKRRRTAPKSSKKRLDLNIDVSGDKDSGLVVEGAYGNTKLATGSQNISAVFGSDSAALLAQISADPFISNQLIERSNIQPVEQTQKDEPCKGGSKCGNDTSSELDLSTSSFSSPVTPVKDKVKAVKKKVARNSRVNKQKEENNPESEQKCVENIRREANVNEGSELKSNTVRISFEDFLRSQSKEEKSIVQCDGTKIAQDTNKMDTHQFDTSTSNGNVASTELAVQISPRTITIQAQMHTISPNQEAKKPEGRRALLNNRRKGARSAAKKVPYSHTEPVTTKWKSNVVLEEEELDLAVLESESTPKCPDIERRQFMAAFKQPGLDGSKAKMGKNQAKRKQSVEIDVEENDLQENKIVTKAKSQRKCRKAANTVTASSKSPVVASPVHSDDIREQPNASLNPSNTALRRSRREAVFRQTPKVSETSPVRNRRNLDCNNDSAKTSVKLSHRKIRKSKYGVYKAKIVCPPDEKESPIRIKLRRVHQNVSEGGKNSSLASNASDNAKKQNKAKKLVEKAKAVQQIKRDAIENKRTLRRSSRTEASISKSYCEDENSVFCLDDDLTVSPQKVPQKSKTKKSLRNLNDVLGKVTKAPPDSKCIQEKNARKASAVISIFDESSQQSSENSQDDEQFRARREFLKSGLPESFKKQIAKAAATKETYTLSCSSFQPVIHTMQIPNGCALWSLPWPQSPQLCSLKELRIPVPDIPLHLKGPLCLKTKPERGVFCERSSGWRLEMSEKVRQLLVEEVCTSNPLFLGETFMSRLMARRADNEQQHSEPVRKLLSPEPVGGKRKRMDDKVAKMAKKQRAAHHEGNIFNLEPEASSRTRRKRQTQRSRLDKAKDKSLHGTDDDVVVLDDLCEDTEKKVEANEDVLWTEKYQPQHSSDIIGNTTSVRQLHSWLKEWKLRADREERSKQRVKEQEGSNDSDWDCGDEDCLSTEDLLCNTVLITGPTGIGKTATVYACAQELGFKVFEVNASSQRSGRLILSQLKEATQSHQVDNKGVNANKPIYFNSHGTNTCTVKPESSPRKLNSPRKVVSSPRKPPNSPRGAKRVGLAPTSLANFFKIGRPSNKEPLSTKQDDQKASKKSKAQEDTRKEKATVNSPKPSAPKERDEQSKKTATSLILFEEVDVIFEEDSGFLAAIKTFMSTTKRPVILTTSDPTFSTVFDGNFEEIYFKKPSLLDVSSYLRLLCLAEDTRTDQRDVSTLLELNDCDIRQSLLQLQFWTRSAGGRHVTLPSGDINPNGNEVKPETIGEASGTSSPTVTSPWPPCESGCTESLLGLLNIEPARDVWELLRSQTHEMACWELLMDSTRRGVNLLYSNMETLLPLPRRQLFPTYKLEPPSVSSPTCLQLDPLPSHSRQLHSSESVECSDDGSPVKVSHRMKKKKKRHWLSNQDGQQSDSDSEEHFLSLSKQQEPPQAKEESTEMLVPQMEKRKPPTPSDRLKSIPVSKCLESISDFFDTMSDIDSLLVHHGSDAQRGHLQDSVSATPKDGMTDESKVESNTLSCVMGQRVLEIQSVVEALSFHKCRLTVTEALARAQQLERKLADNAVEELTLPVASHCESYSFTQSSLCRPQMVQQRRDLMESVVCRGPFSTLCNRSAAAVDYLPVLRTICRSEQIKEQGKVKRRFLHYLDSIHLGLHKNTLQHLSADFP